MDCGYSLEPPSGSNEYPQFMFSSKNKKSNLCPCKPLFYYIKVGFKGSKLYKHVFVMSKVYPFTSVNNFGFSFITSTFCIGKITILNNVKKKKNLTKCVKISL